MKKLSRFNRSGYEYESPLFFVKDKETEIRQNRFKTLLCKYSKMRKKSPKYNYNGYNDSCDICRKPLSYSDYYYEIKTLMGILRAHEPCLKGNKDG